MLDELKQALLVALGAIDVTEEKLRAAVDGLVKRGQLSEQQARELVDEWARRGREGTDRLQHQVEEAIRRALDRLDVARRRDLDALAARVAALERVTLPDRERDEVC